MSSYSEVYPRRRIIECKRYITIYIFRNSETAHSRSATLGGEYGNEYLGCQMHDNNIIHDGRLYVVNMATNILAAKW